MVEPRGLLGFPRLLPTALRRPGVGSCSEDGSDASIVSESSEAWVQSEARLGRLLRLVV